ncbi:unnamed protein product [Parascedosporium putredinis]|uniref:Micro-fibrillar-associated protein 1 C-terminal domain-containing protein n=1 Tax=Parascedosporium putredinis TaxID=1442378 RepID=A0A9P1GXK2_9PEZI|nr:unnamed protein product [Parascedosporium putredinis]CAI7990686.1 unnamed protein product [Parascedosporium putredinis]
MPPKRMTANPVRPARHRPGKPAGGVDSESSSEEDSSEDEQAPAATHDKKKPQGRAPPPKAISAKGISGAMRGVDLSKTDEAARKEKKEEREAMERMAADAGFITESEEEVAAPKPAKRDEEEEEESEEESSEEEEESSEEESEEERPRLMLRPKFIPKSQRGKGEKTEAEKDAEEEARKKAEAHELVEEQIQKDMAARAAGKNHWDDDSGAEGEQIDVDDTDDLDPAAELAAFRLRKLKRYKRDREAMLEREREIEELERRRNLTEEERRAEDDAKLEAQRVEKEGRGKLGYMQKYFHGARFTARKRRRRGWTSEIWRARGSPTRWTGRRCPSICSGGT